MLLTFVSFLVLAGTKNVTSKRFAVNTCILPLRLRFILSLSLSFPLSLSLSLSLSLYVKENSAQWSESSQMLDDYIDEVSIDGSSTTLTLTQWQQCRDHESVETGKVTTCLVTWPCCLCEKLNWSNTVTAGNQGAMAATLCGLTFL